MRQATSLFFAASFALMLLGCGGGGSGGSGSTGGTTATGFPISVDWTSNGTTRTPTGGSEKITVSPLSTPTSQTAQVLANAPASTSPILTSKVTLATGKYVVHVDLYSGPSQTGTITGSLDALINTAVNTGVQIEVGKPISTIVVGPTQATVAVNGTEAFFASPKASDGTYTFAAPSDLTFASSPSTTISVAANPSDTASCIATGLVTGTATITATAASTSVSGSVTAAVSTVSNAHKSWTIMVFLNAANNLVQYALPNYRQMQQSVQGTGANIIVIWKEAASTGSPDFSPGTYIYQVQPAGAGSAIVGQPLVSMGTGVDMGSYKTLAQFLAYCKKNFPADHYLLDMWDHGEGWQNNLTKAAPKFRGISLDQDTGHIIDTYQMNLALEQGGFNSSTPLDILTYDACLMQMLECGYQVQGDVHYIAATEDLTPAPGFDYSVAFLPFFQNPTGDPATLARSFTDQMINDTTNGGMYTGQTLCQSVVDVTQLPNVASAVNSLGSALLANKSTIGPIVDNVRSGALTYDPGYYFFYYDLWDVANRLQNSSGVPSAVATAAANVKTAVSSAVLYNRYTLGDTGSMGLAIDFSDAVDFNNGSPTYSSQYGQMSLATAGAPQWYAWLKVAP